VKSLLLLIVLFFSSHTLSDDFRPASLTIQSLSDVQADNKSASQSNNQAKNQFKVTWKVPIKNRQLPQLHVVFDSLTKEKLPKRSRSVDGSYIQSWQISRENNLSGFSVFIDGLKGSGYEVILRVPSKNAKIITQLLNSDTSSFNMPKNQHLTTLDIITSYTTLGFEHILAGLDHLLFVLALILLVTSRKKLIWTITFFTLAHSITLAAVTLDWFFFPGPPVEAVIALSIIFLAKEAITVNRGKASFTAKYPWLVAFIFGLLHGMGFASALNEIGLPDNEIFLALLSFNIGVELGQLTFVLVALSIIAICKRLLTKLPDWTKKIPAYAIGCTASFWLIQRLLMF